MDARDVLTSRCTAREKRTKLACAACGARTRAARASHRMYARMRVSMTIKKLLASRGGASRACARVYRANSRARARHITSRVEVRRPSVSWGSAGRVDRRSRSGQWFETHTPGHARTLPLRRRPACRRVRLIESSNASPRAPARKWRVA